MVCKPWLTLGLDQNAFTKNRFEFKKMVPLPNQEPYYSLEFSLDRYPDFLKIYGNLKELPLLSVTIYDENIITNHEDVIRIHDLICYLNNLNIKDITFKLSDSTMPVYNIQMSNLNWQHSDKTKIFLTIDRNPTVKKDLQLEHAQGKLVLKEEDLLYTPFTVLEILQKKVDAKTLRNAQKLKEIVRDFYLRLDSMYQIKEFTEFDKVYMAYDFIKRHISFAQEATRTENGRQVLYNPNHMFDWSVEPLGTYKHKKGVCTGQARLMQALINNEYFRSDTKTIGGNIPLGKHTWVGTVINDELYQTCLTTGSLLQDLSKRGFIPDNDELYPRIYHKNGVTKEDIALIKQHINTLRK